MKNIMVHLVLFTLLTGCSGIEWFPSTSVITITPVTLPAPTFGVAYSQTLTASGGTAPYTWTISSGTPPAGLTLSPAGILSGDSTTAGSYTFTVKVTDSKSSTATQTYTLVSSQITIDPPALPTVFIDGNAFSLQMNASGGTAPYTWTVSSGTLPAWLTLDPTTGTFDGTPTAVGTTIFTVKVTDSKSLSAIQTYTLTTLFPLAIVQKAYSSATLNQPYRITIKATGGLLPYSWTISGDPLPTGLVFSQISSSAVISGIPTAATTPNVTVTVTDSENQAATDSITGILFLFTP
jgi:hypothetical protein